MKMTTCNRLVALSLCVMVIAGCQALCKGMTDEEMVDANMRVWAQGLIAHDMEIFLSVVSENFTSPQAADKQALADFITQAIDSGYLDEAEVSFEEAELTFDEEAGVCSVYPVDLMSAAGSVSLELVFSKEDRNWLLTSLEVDGM